MARRFRLVLTVCAVCLVGVLAVFQSDAQTFAKYRSLADPKTFVTSAGMSERLPIWKGVVQMIEQRPVTGYGYGWKKMAYVIGDYGFDTLWQRNGSREYFYFVTVTNSNYGRVNPHNLVLQIVFEIGLVGLLLVGAFWAVIIARIVKVGRKGMEPQVRRYLLCSLSIMTGYILMNITNGFWQEMHGNLMMLFAATVIVLTRSETTEAAEMTLQDS